MFQKLFELKLIANIWTVHIGTLGYLTLFETGLIHFNTAKRQVYFSKTKLFLLLENSSFCKTENKPVLQQIIVSNRVLLLF